MKSKLWLFNLPFVLLFFFFYWVTELGVQGNLDQPFLREKAFPALSKVRNLLTDLKFKVRGAQNPKNKIVIVEIDSSSLETLGRWPWHRDVTAFLIEKTFVSGAKVVGLDMVFSEPDLRIPEELGKILKEKGMESIIPQFETDQQLQAIISKYSDRLVLAWTTELVCQPYYEKPEFCPVKDPNAVSQFNSDYDRFAIERFYPQNGFDPGQTPMISFVTPIGNIASYHAVAKHIGYINAILDSDGVIRRTNLIAFGKAKPFPSIALEMARVGLGEELEVKLDAFHRTDSLIFNRSQRSLGVTPLGAMEINFRGPTSTFTRISALDLMSEKETLEDETSPELVGKLKSDVLKDAYVFIGVSAIGVYDLRNFPFGENMPGVGGHANILDNLLSGDPLIPSSKTLAVWIIPFLIIFGALFFSVGIEKLGAIAALSLFVLVFSIGGLIDFKYLFPRNQNWNTVFIYLEYALVFVFTLAMKYVLEERDKKFIRGAFSKYVAPQIIESILKDPTKLSLGGEKRELTIIFSDIRSFTTFSEKMDAKALASFLNDYLGIMTKLVFDNQGTLDKYIGDAIMAFWGAPLQQDTHAWNSCKSATSMMKALDEHQARFKSQYDIDVAIGIGINSGVVNVGNMGSEQNFEYTVIGDSVNLASRLEGLTKEYGVEILTTRYTFDSIERSGKELFPHRILDFVKVKGKQTAVELIQVFHKEMNEEGLKIFAQARGLYKSQSWRDAILLFEKANSLLVSPENWDGPCKTFIARCRYFQEKPPAADWDGSWKMESK